MPNNLTFTQNIIGTMYQITRGLIKILTLALSIYPNILTSRSILLTVPAVSYSHRPYQYRPPPTAGDTCSFNDNSFYPRPVLAFGYCRCLRLCVCVCVCVCLSVCLCVNHLLVRTITRDLFKLGSPNLDQRCKRPWLRSLLFWGAIDLDLQGQI